MGSVRVEQPTKYFSSLYEKYGVDERSLGWSKHKQDYRFYQAARYMQDSNSVLDIGCGFADLYDYLRKRFTGIEYYGIDVMEEYVNIAANKYQGENATFCCTDFWGIPWDRTWDWIVECGLFGLRQFDDEGMYEYIDRTMKKAMDLANVGIAFNFLSDKVDYTTSGTDFHINPERILGMAYKYSRRVLLDNSILPFEYSVTIWKNDGFLKEKTVFSEAEELVK